MANYYATSRTNYFRVKDRTAFENWLAGVRQVEIKTWEKSDDANLIAMSADHGDCFGWLSNYTDDDDVDHNFFEEFAEHLVEGEVAIFLEVGAEKLRYLTGYALAVNAQGETLRVSIEDIFSLVKREWGVTPTDAVY